jgi:hypothetical protein
MVMAGEASPVTISERDDMFATIRRARAWRTALLVAVVSAASAVAAGAAVSGPRAAIASTPAATSQTRSVSCNAFEFQPVDSATGSDYFNSKRIRSGMGGSGFFTCNPGLPTRAVVTKVQFSIWDGSGSSQMKYCGLYRSGLGGATAAETVKELAAVPPTGIAQAPGFARLTDITIQYAVIDNSRWAYWLQCNIEQAGQSLGLYGADVIYTISAVNG